MEIPVIERFKKAVEDVIDAGLAKSKKEIASELGFSPSYLSEILNNRINLSAENLQKFCRRYEQSADTILGILIKKNAYTPPSHEANNIINEPTTEYTLVPKTGNVSPKTTKTVSPTVSPTLEPTLENCLICAEKERVIESLESRIGELKDHIETLKSHQEDQAVKRGKAAG
jgi:transcriptional regulator with XRE-family HTH domain